MPERIELRRIRKDSPELAELEAINQEAIPESERNSLSDLLNTGADGNLAVIGILADDTPAGFLAVRSFRSTRYLAYFAVRRDLRSQGLGSRALQALLSRYADCQTVVEYEAPPPDCGESHIRRRRQRFYRRNGFSQTGWYTFYDGTEFEIACAGKPYDAAEFAAFIDYLGTVISDHIPQPYRKALRDRR